MNVETTVSVNTNETVDFIVVTAETTERVEYNLTVETVARVD